MDILFLGTGAADWPIEEQKSYSFFRRNSAALIDDCLLIDPGPCVEEAMQAFGVDPKKIRYILNTHPHEDHLDEPTLARLTALGAEFTVLNPQEEITLGPYTVRAEAANHGTVEHAVHFFITDGKSNLFYALDSAWLLYDEVQTIIERKADLLVLDATIGDCPGDYRIFEHNNLNMVLEMQKTLQPYVKQFAISHMARTLHTAHADLVRRMEPFGVTVAYDGLRLTF